MGPAAIMGTEKIALFIHDSHAPTIQRARRLDRRARATMAAPAHGGSFRVLRIVPSSPAGGTPLSERAVPLCWQ
ncbi:hypothetical protein E2562_028871 [Oryza meyeriana var. granulata]|uniref:Uncharacterized protein n=1 Tax=Oryza meyeriana var. granulata TaxID=110450 RepID=A0A6G1FD47_9ORYZ|nr:hypothetical protein E2562_028871 [Oryza meyeriana var. granulata]